MPSELASVIALLLYAAGLAPVVWMAVRPRSANWLAPTSGLLVVGLAIAQTGIFNRGELSSTDISGLVEPNTNENRCREAFDLLIENGVLLEQPGEGGIVVRGALWDQMPSAIKTAVLACAQNASGATDASAVEVTRR